MSKKPVRKSAAREAVTPQYVLIDPQQRGALSVPDLSLRERMAIAAANGAGLLGASKYGQQDASKAARGILDFIPGVGDALTADDLKRSIADRDMLGTGINSAALAVGMVPMVGDVAGKVIKSKGDDAVKAGIRAFHGSPLTNLTDLRPSQRGPLGPGVYASPFENVARMYAGDGGKSYAFNVDGLFNGMGRIGVGPDDNHFQIWRDQTARLIAAAPAEKREKIATIVSKLSSDDGYRLYGDIARELGGDEPAQSLFRAAGFKGVSAHVDGPEINMFDAVGLPKAGIRAFHGSPHSFDRFSLDKIGTGEGAQAYGHGLYFADNEGVAKSYRDTLSNADPSRFTTENAKQIAEGSLQAFSNDLPGALADLEASLSITKRRVSLMGPDAKDSARLQDLQEAINYLKEGPSGGSMYEVNINANPDDFLDWDKPLSEQPQVAQRLGYSTMSEDAIHAEAEAIMTAKPKGAWMNDPASKARIDELQAMLDIRVPNQTGADYYRGGNDGDVSNILSQMGYGNPEAATEALRAKGIPGIKYLDAGSRSAGDGSRNYVVFDDKLIDIVRKYGIAGASAMLGYSVLSGADEAQAGEINAADAQFNGGGNMIEVELPDGTIAEFPEGTSPDIIKGALRKRFGTPQAQSSQPMQQGMAELSGLTRAAGQASQHDVDTKVRAEMEASKLQQIRPKGTWRDFNDSAMGSIPFQDEIFSATLGNVGRMVRDQVGPVEAYQREMALQEALRAQREKRSPVASTAGNIAGSIGTGLAAAGGGLTMAGKALPVIGKTGAAALEGGLYGGLYGAGEGRGTERLGNAARGATIGAVTAGALSKGGDMVAGRMARKAVPAAPAASALKSEASGLFDQAYESGIRVTKQAQTRLAQNMKLVSDIENVDARPETFGVLKDVMAKSKMGQYADVQTLHDLRRRVGDAMVGAKLDDVRTLSRMKRVIDAFIDNPPKGAISGPPQGFEILRKAIGVSAKEHKAALIEKTLDLADVAAQGNYTQSGLQNALKTKFSALYKQILDKNVSGFTAEEIAMIRSLASKQTSPKALNWLAKWTPKGPMATTLAAIFGGGGGALFGGPAGAALGTGAIMAPGWLAGRAVDKSAMSVANALRDSAARGGAAVLPKVANPLLPYSLPGALTATELQRQYQR